MNALSNATLVALFALALSVMLWAAWGRTADTTRVVTAVVVCAILAAVDVVMIVTQTPPAP